MCDKHGDAAADAGRLSRFLAAYFEMEAYRNATNLSLIIQPGDSFFPLVSAIDSAVHSMKMTIFRMDDPIVREAMKAAVARGVRVQALVARDSKGWVKRNRKLSADLAELGIDVRVHESPNRKIRRYHYKILTVDDAQSLILTFNPTQVNLHYARDFGVLIRDREVTAELNRLFDADWNGEKFKPGGTALVISPDNSRRRVIELLRSATRSIRIMDAKVRDQEIMVTLIHKSAAGCDVKIIGRDVLDDKVLPNFHVKGLARFKLHAKCIVVDGKWFFVGSQNLRKVSLNSRREVGIIIEDDVMARRIERVFDEDWTSGAELVSEPGRPA